MASADLKRRLQSLKSMTEDLKHSTTSPHINFNHIKTLIHDLRDASQSNSKQSAAQGFPDSTVSQDMSDSS
jgi:hypothetical protein